MSTTAPEPIPLVDNHLLNELAHFYTLLQMQGFAVGVQECLDAEDLLARLLRGRANHLGFTEQEYTRIAEHLSPIFCRHAGQQRQFKQVFSQWLSVHLQATPNKKPKSKAEGKRRTDPPNPTPLSVKVDKQVAKSQASIRRNIKTKLKWYLGLFALLILILVSFILYETPNMIPGLAQDSLAESSEKKVQIATKGSTTEPVEEELGENIDASEGIEEKLGENVDASEGIEEKLGENIDASEGIEEELGENIDASEGIEEELGENIDSSDGIEEVETPKKRIPEKNEQQQLQLKSIPPRSTLLTPELSEKRKRFLSFFKMGLISLPNLLFLIWLIIALVKRQVNLKLAKSNANPFSRLNLLLNPQHPFAKRALFTPLRASFLRSAPQLNIVKSLERTLKNGLFSPVSQRRLKRPEYLLLTARQAGNDHRASLAQALLAQMRDKGLQVQPYEYIGSPQVCYALDTGQQKSIQQLQQRYGEARLIITGDGKGLFHPLSGEAYAVVQALGEWSQRIFLSTQATPWGLNENELSAAGFLVAPLSSSGLQSVGAWLKKSEQKAAQASPDTALPPAFKYEAERWLLRSPPSDYKPETLIQCLTDYLGEDAFKLLSACALYPQMVGNLAIALDQQLFINTGNNKQSPEMREQRLLSIARLPWAQRGKMPLYLRELLVSQLSPSFLEKTVKAYEVLFNQASIQGKAKPSSGLNLPFTSVAKTDLKQSLRQFKQLLRFAPSSSVLSDTLFADIILGQQRTSLTRFLLPKKLAEKLPGKRWGWGQIFRSIALATVITAMVYLSLFLLRSALYNWQLNNMLTANAKTDIEIYYTPESTVYAQVMQQQLAARGFENISLLPVEENTTEALRGPISAREQLIQVQELLAYIRWNNTEKTKEETIQYSESNTGIRLNLILPAQHKNVFRDHLDKPLDKNRWQQQLSDMQEMVAVSDARLEAQAQQEREEKEEEQGGEETSTATPVPTILPSSLPMAQPTVVPTPLPTAAPQPTASIQLESGVQILRDTLRDGSKGPAMVVVPAGKFLMGSTATEEGSSNEGPQREVQIQAFAMAQTKLTFADYAKYAQAEGKALPDDDGKGQGERPVINVGWWDAQLYAGWLTKQTGATYRLPSEAEWEYAANNFGLYDMIGDAWEWLEDCWHSDYRGAPKSGAAWLFENSGNCDRRVLRGGIMGFLGGPRYAKQRYWLYKDQRGVDTGIRLARTLSDEEMNKLPEAMGN